MKFTFISLLATASLALAQVQISINPHPNVTRDFPGWAALPPPAPSQPATDTKRFTADLPISESRSRRPHQQLRRAPAPHRFGTRVRAAPQAVFVPPPRITYVLDLLSSHTVAERLVTVESSQKCNIFVESETEYYGYLAPTFNRYGEYGVLQQSQNGSLEVSIAYRPSSPNRIEFLAMNGPVGSYPYVGGITGFSSKGGDLGLGSFNYAYLGGTAQTPPKSPPVQAENSFSIVTSIPQEYESAIWGLDPDTMAITVQWTNRDRSTPATHLVYADDDNSALLLTGDVEELQYAFDVSYPEVVSQGFYNSSGN